MAREGLRQMSAMPSNEKGFIEKLVQGIADEREWNRRQGKGRGRAKARTVRDKYAVHQVVCVQ